MTNKQRNKRKLIEIHEGISRICFLIGNYAIKVPSFRSWGRFLTGLLNNKHEANWHNRKAYFCPVIFACPGGFFNVYPRCQPVQKNAYKRIYYEIRRDRYRWVENKAANYGIYQDRVVALDFGMY